MSILPPKLKLEKSTQCKKVTGRTAYPIMLHLFFILLTLQTSYAIERIALPEVVGKPRLIVVDNKRLFIAERTTVHIFSLPMLTYVKSFGRQGLGPGEFRKINQFFVADNQLHLSSLMEANIFSINGKFLRRLRTTKHVIDFIPFKDKYIGWGSSREASKKYIMAYLFDGNLGESKIIYKYLSVIQENNKVPFIFYKEFAVPIGDRMYINTPKGTILCFSKDGKVIKTISPDIKKIPITKTDQESILHFYRRSRLGKMIYQMHGNRLFMPTHFPYIMSLKAGAGKLLLVTYERKGGRQRVIVLDGDGNRIGSKGLFLELQDSAPIDFYSYSIYENKCYQLAENLEAETWEVHISSLSDWESVK